MKIRKYHAEISARVALTAPNQTRALEFFRQLIKDGMTISNMNGDTQATVRRRRIRLVGKEVIG